MPRPIVTLTLNPALDVSAQTPTVVPGPKLRCADARLDPGGGGVNVSRAIAHLGGQSQALVATGGVTGALVCQLLEAEGVPVTRVEIDGLTRQSFAITAADSGAQFRFVLPGPAVSPAAIAAIQAAVAAALVPGALLVVSGSLPPGAGPDVLVALNRQAVAAGAEMILDTSGAGLVGAVAASPLPVFVLRVDGEEAEQLVGRPLGSPGEMAAAARSLLADGKATHVVMALGSEGTLGVSAGEGVFCRPPLIETVSAVGAGDSLVGAMALALSRGAPFREAVAFGTAAAAAAVMTPATALCDRSTTEALVPRIIQSDL